MNKLLKQAYGKEEVFHTASLYDHASYDNNALSLRGAIATKQSIRRGIASLTHSSNGFPARNDKREPLQDLSIAAFSLIELMVVIVIIGIIGIIAVPNMRSWYAGFQIRSCADNITNTLVTARMSAIKNGNNQVVFFYTANNCPTTVVGINTNAGKQSCYFTINDATNTIAAPDIGLATAGEFNGVVNTCSSNIVFPAAIVQKSGAAFSVPTTYCTVTGNNIQPCTIPNSCTFCNGDVGAVSFQPDGSALLLGTAGACNGSVCGGSVTIIPSSDAATNDGSREYAIGIISLTGAVKEFY